MEPHLHQGTLVIYGGIAGIGFIEGAMKETLENTSGFKVGTDFGLAYNPILHCRCFDGKFGVESCSDRPNQLKRSINHPQNVNKKKSKKSTTSKPLK